MQNITTQQLEFTLCQPGLCRAAVEIVAKLQANRYIALFAGGCVRDALLQRQIKDIDIATSATPDQIEELFQGNTYAVGKSFGVIVVQHKGFNFDVATFRQDGKYYDGRHPAAIHFTTPDKDSARRDFTINGMFYDPLQKQIHDYHHGMQDLADGIIRAIGDPLQRFNEDCLRMLRAIRFAAVLEFAIDDQTWQAIIQLAPEIRKVSMERIGVELTRILCEAPAPSTGMRQLFDSGLLGLLLPEVGAMQGVEQPPQYHPEGDVWTHTLLMIDSLSCPRTPEIVWAALLHDVGKPPTACKQMLPDGRKEQIRFPSHAAVGSAMTTQILRRLKQPSALVECVTWLVAEHMRVADAPKMRTAKLRRFLGASYFSLLLELLYVDTLHSTKDFTIYNFLQEAYQHYQDEPVLPPPLVQGRDLLGWGMSSGPTVGKALQQLYDAQLEGEFDSLPQAKKLLHQWGYLD